MEVEEQGEASCVVSAGSTGSVSVSLHPLVIMNISDHFTRVRVQQQDEGKPPLGALSLEWKPALHKVLLGVCWSSYVQCMALYWARRRGAALRYATRLSW